ncbi:uncharacterized protein LOC115821260 [Chanos chanos]|uniref:Uncharacterized protein LOC115821260 n=1 Tax=Chanos chanos TaxID=29144 RepID=A0A6J2W634_CHACN|nr:uncharacterized protein LOC115821260 [Chanos chanos]
MPHETWSPQGVRPQVKPATGGLVSCPFCPRTAEYPAVAAHLQSHQRSMVQYEGYDIYKCHLACLKEGHYHCDMCQRAIGRKELFEKHLRKCSSSRQHQAVTPDVTVVSDPSSPETDIHTECKIPECPPRVQHKRPERVTCVHCHIVINKKNLNVHIRRKHSKATPDIHAGHHLPSTCVDPKRGLFVVSQSFQRIAHPIHVQKCTWGDERVTACELDRCHQVQEVTRRSGLVGHECQHLRSIVYAPLPTAPDNLRKEVLLQMAGERWVTNSTVEACLKRQEEAEAEGTPVTVIVTLGKDQHETYISVFEPQVRTYSKLGRVLVHYDQHTNTWHCPCVTPHKSCLHKSLAKWQLFQVKPELFKMDSADDIHDTLTMESVVGEDVVETGSASAIPLYQPKGEELHGMLQYVIVDIPKHLFPHETRCVKCEGQPPLSEPTVITTKATVVSFLGVVEDVTAYCTRCAGCGNFYRHGEKFAHFTEEGRATVKGSAPTVFHVPQKKKRKDINSIPGEDHIYTKVWKGYSEPNDP